MLLQRKDVNPDHICSKYGRTPLLMAAQNGHEGAVKMLLERKDVNPDQADTEHGQTPLIWAAKNGHREVVKMLLEREGVNPDHRDTFYGQTPLVWAAENGHDQVVRILSEWNDFRPAVPDSENQTPPSPTLSEGRDWAARIVLDPDDANSNKVGHAGEASLSPSENDLPVTEPSVLPQPSSILPLKFPYSRRKSGTNPSNTHSTQPIAVNRYWVIGSCVFLIAFLAYRKNSHN